MIGTSVCTETDLSLPQHGANAQWWTSEVVRLGLLSAMRQSAEEGSTSGDQIWTLLIHLAVDHEEFLLPTDVGHL